MLQAKVQAILFASGKPLSVKALAKALSAKTEDIHRALESLKGELNQPNSGVHLIDHNGQLQMVTNPEFGPLIQGLVKDEFDGELTRPQLETLSIICYRGPVTKPEIEQIRGVNCSLIIRHLLIRGLIEEAEDAARLQSVYTVSTEFVRHLGLSSLEALPEFERFNADERIAKLLEESSAGEEPL